MVHIQLSPLRTSISGCFHSLGKRRPDERGMLSSCIKARKFGRKFIEGHSALCVLSLACMVHPYSKEPESRNQIA
jgi:hypothetical protein